MCIDICAGHVQTPSRHRAVRVARVWEDAHLQKLKCQEADAKMIVGAVLVVVVVAAAAAAAAPVP